MRSSANPLQQVLIFITLHEDLFQEMEGVLPGCLFASYSYEAGLFDDRIAFARGPGDPLGD